MATLLLIALSCQTIQEELVFSKLTAYWVTQFPNAQFAFLPLRFCDGPDGTRLHVAVPVEVEKECLFPFSRASIERKLKSRRAVDRFVADDLLQLKKPLLFTYGCTVGLDGKSMVECRAYVVRSRE